MPNNAKSFKCNGKGIAFNNSISSTTKKELENLPSKYKETSFGVPHYEGETFELESFKVQAENTEEKVPAFGVFLCKGGSSISLTALCRRGNGITWKFDEEKTGENIANYLCLLLANNVNVTLKVSKIIVGKGTRKDKTEFTSKTYIFEPVVI